MKVLLSIKPEFANKIFDGTKRYEYRKSIFKQPNVEKVIVYASQPTKRVIGEFMIETILMNDVESIWEATAPYAGISKAFYLSYFANKDKAYAIKIGEFKLYEEAKELSDYNIHTAPQSFAYLK